MVAQIFWSLLTFNSRFSAKSVSAKSSFHCNWFLTGYRWSTPPTSWERGGHFRFWWRFCRCSECPTTGSSPSASHSRPATPSASATSSFSCSSTAWLSPFSWDATSKCTVPSGGPRHGILMTQGKYPLLMRVHMRIFLWVHYLATNKAFSPIFAKFKGI